jgi:hypothetical protein
MPNKKIEWGNIPMKGEEYADKLTIKKINAIENGKNQGSINAKNGTVVKAGKAAGIVNTKNGQLDSIRNLEKTKKAQSEVGKKFGKLNVENGHLSKIRPAGGKVAGKITVESGRIKEIQKLAYQKTSKKVLATRIRDNKKFEFKSISEAGRKLNCQPSNICKHLKGMGKSVSGYTFEYKK